MLGRAATSNFSMPLQEQNYWLTTTEFPRTDLSRPLPEVVDVAVIGAGFTGLSAARTLAKRGARVAVLESETIGWGASSRNGGMVLTGISLAIGLPGAWMAAKLADSFLYGVRPHDLVTFTAVPIILAAIALLACWIPARRAARVDPQTVLRYE